ncbi:MAG: DUF4129 domain-containing transglutaminase family protein, partial [Ardenticatenaceae bacterium]
GYSDYFGSSMAVLLRAAGVPARMAAGYAPGEFDPESGLRIVRDFDSHGWVQAYFPSFGWIDFEPTTRWPVAQRSLSNGPGSDEAADRLGSSALPGDPDDIFDPNIERLGEGEEILGGDVTGGGSIAETTTSVAIPLLIALGSVAVLWVLMQALWTLSLGNASPVDRAYTKMSRLGGFAGLRRQANQTPVEYATAIGNALPLIRPAAHRIAAAYTGNRYGRREVNEDEQQELEKAWRSMRGSLVMRSLRRLIPIAWS